MSKWKKDSFENNIKKELIIRAEDGQRISKKDICREFYHIAWEAKTVTALLAKIQVSAIFKSVQHHFRALGIPFSSLNSNDEYGIPDIKEEVDYSGINRYKMTKGLIHGAGILVNFAMKNKIISGTFSKREEFPLAGISRNAVLRIEAKKK